jgi:hypothetical protein
LRGGVELERTLATVTAGPGLRGCGNDGEFGNLAV